MILHEIGIKKCNYFIFIFIDIDKYEYNYDYKSLTKLCIIHFIHCIYMKIMSYLRFQICHSSTYTFSVKKKKATYK